MAKVIAVVILALLSGCASPQGGSKSISENAWTVELSKVASQQLINDLFDRPWYAVYLTRMNRKPVMAVDLITNRDRVKVDINDLKKSLEHQIKLSNKSAPLSRELDFLLVGELTEVPDQKIMLKLKMLDYKTGDTVWSQSYISK